MGWWWRGGGGVVVGDRCLISVFFGWVGLWEIIDFLLDMDVESHKTNVKVACTWSRPFHNTVL